MKKYIQLGLIIISIVLVYGNFYYLFFTPYGNINTSYSVENFEKYKKDYEIACNEIVKLAESNGFDVNKGETYYIEFSSIRWSKGKISKASLNSFEKIAESFPNDDHSHNFHYINYSKHFISFTSKSGLYSIVFSFNDKRPTDEVNPYAKEKIAIRTNKIQKNWYHVWR